MRRLAIRTAADPAGVSRATAPPHPNRAEVLLTAAALPLMLVLNLTAHARPLSITGTLILVMLAWLPLTVRSRWPLPVLAVVVAVDTVHIALAGHAHPATTVIPVATMLALYTVAASYPTTSAWLAAAVVAVVQFGVGLASHRTGSDWLYLNRAVVATVIGSLMKERRDRIAAADLRAETAQRTKQAEADRRVTAERMRIAHDLHDVLAHHIAVVNAQAGVAQYLLERDPAAAATALAGITTNSKAALDELRAALGLLRAEGDPTPRDRRPPAPTIEQLDRLLGEFSEAGMRLHTSTHGIPGALSGPAELAFYRIVQEALTNATKHAPGSDVRLAIGRPPASNSPSATPPPPAPWEAASSTKAPATD